MTPTPPVLTLQGLAALLEVPVELAEALVLAHEVPHVRIGKSRRFATSQILAWLERVAVPGGAELLPPAEPEPLAEPVRGQGALAEVAAAEAVWLDATLTDALLTGAEDPSRNLDRLRLRDALLELNDGLRPLLVHLSGGRLRADPEERTRTSPWRLDRPDEGPIEAMSIAWGDPGGDPGRKTTPPQFADRRRLRVELRPGLLRALLESGTGHLVLGGAEVSALEESGFTVDGAALAAGALMVHSVSRAYALPARGVSLAAVVATLSGDLETTLVPLWKRVPG
jgi:excisionase family DNA binding protein